MTFDPTSVEVTCVTTTQGSLFPSPMKIHQCGYSDPFCKRTKGHWPLDDLWPQICWGHMCDSTQGSLCPNPIGIHQCMWIQWSILQMTNQRSLTPRWPLTPHLLRSYVWLYPRIIVSKSHENTSKYVDAVTFFAKQLEPGGSLTPRWPLTPHLLRSHVWLYPRIIVSKSHGNTSMYVDTVINFANYHIHTHTYYIHTTYRISDHIVSLRRDKNVMIIYLSI